jgi:sec-independent protein translocase protein TatA
MPFGGGGIGIQEILLLALLAILLYGTKQLPQLGRSAGEGMREFKDSVTSFKKPIDEVTRRSRSTTSRTSRRSEARKRP